MSKASSLTGLGCVSGVGQNRTTIGVGMLAKVPDGARIALRGISKRFGGVTALDAIDWSVGGEVHCLVGENGSGKSTLIKIVTGVHQPDAGGQLVVDGEPINHMTPALARQLGIQVIFQDLSLFPNLSVAENVGVEALIGRPLGLARRKRMAALARETLAELGQPLPLDAEVGTLSVAHRQIVAIARGVAASAQVLFMDEPTASLTRAEVERLFQIVRNLRAKGVSIVFVSHRLEEIAEIADRVSVLRDGRMVASAPVAEMDDTRISELMTGEAQHVDAVEKRVLEDDIVLSVRNAKREGEFEDVSFDIRRGEVLGLTGLLGSGRTELALSLFGMRPLHGGEIRLDGEPCRFRSNRDAIRAGIVYVSEDRLSLGLNLRQSIADNVSLTVLHRLTDGVGDAPASRRRELSETWVERLGIKADDVGAPVTSLSGGNQQRVVLAKWLATEPKVLILDSPTVGVDIRNKRGIYDLIRSLAEAGVAILMISDEVPEVYFNADRVLCMERGRIAAEFRPGECHIRDLESEIYA